MSTKTIGDNGEDRAVSYLINKGYTIKERNYRSNRGEIDIIATIDGVYVFVEVKTRSSKSYGSGVDAVTLVKQKKIIYTANRYLLNKGDDWLARFDIISIDSDEINHIENAFEL